MIEYRTLTVGPLETNCYIIWDSQTRNCAIIDPGGDKELIMSCIEANGLSLDYILLTHGHCDHCFCAGSIAQETNNVRVAMHEDDLALINESLAVVGYFYDIDEYVDVHPTDFISEGDTILLGSSKIEVAQTPGHSPGGLCYIADCGVFCGDTIFAGSIGRTDLPGGSYNLLIQSIRSKILALPDETRLYPGHGPATAVGIERKHNPFLI